MAEDSTAFENKTMESIVVEDASMNQSEAKQSTSVDFAPRATPVMVPVVFEKTNDTNTSSQMATNKREDEQTYACIISSEERPELAAALESLNLLVIYSQDGKRVPDYVPDECDMVFVCELFEGEVYEYLHSRKFRIVGAPCVYSCAKRGKDLPLSSRPVYSCSMEGLVLCFTGFKDKVELSQLCSHAHFMGASIRGDINSSVTHIIAHSVSGSKYKVAVTLGTGIMSEEWINECWRRREDPCVLATDPELMIHKQPPFKGLTIAFYGFSSEEEQHMKETATDNGANHADWGQSGVTHLVVCDNEVDPSHIPHTSSRVQVVKQQWFWESIQIDACADEQLYQAKETHTRGRGRHRPSINTSLHSSMTSVDISALLEASIFSLSSPSSTPTLSKRDSHKRSSLVSNLVSTPNSRSTGGGGNVGGASISAPPTSKADAARKHIVSELLQTERNFVDILLIIVKMFKEPLENPVHRGGPILDSEDVKSIFGNISEILGVHQKLVESLQEQLAEWSETTCIGKVLLEQAEGFVRVYPPFINFFDMSKEALHKCDKTYPRFHAFLKANESKPECSRQTLAELLITPVQRIPRIILLLQDLVKHTDPKHPDYLPLQKAVESLRTVMNHINEDRRKTEGQMQMFEVLRDIEDCPATLLSAQRSFLRRVDVVDIGNPSKGNKGDPIAIFLFSDSIEVAKRRGMTGFSMRNSTAKIFKHLEFIPLIHVRSVVQFRDSDSGELSQSFGLLVHRPEDLQDKLLVFRLAGEETNREEVIEEIARLMAVSKSSANTEQFIITSSSDQLQSMYKSGVSSTTLKRALHGARKKVKRAFSGRQTKRPAQNLSSISVHHNLDGIGEENEPMETEASNTSITSTTSTMTFTPVASLRTPKAKRPALGIMTSFSAADLTNIGNETDV